MANIATAGVYHPQLQCRLLTIAPEIRNRIYDFVFTVATDDDTVKLCCIRNPSTRYGGHHANLTSPSVLVLLQTCRQVLNEAECIFFHVNHFEINCYAVGVRGVLGRSRSPSLNQLRSLRAITIRLYDFSTLTATLRVLIHQVRLLHMRGVSSNDWKDTAKVLLMLTFLEAFAFETTSSDPAIVAEVAQRNEEMKAILQSGQTRS
ncbi:hypothetical protein LTR74_001835 [Friedmanniomyces endolithicus]|nr:hypothetical protein LTR74_001835 [Friedmanniomyces endolithicus]